VRPKAVERLARKLVPHKSVHEVVFDGVQPRRQLIVGDAQLVELFGLVVSQCAEQITDEHLVVRRLTVGDRHRYS